MVLGVATIVSTAAFAQESPSDSKVSMQTSEHKPHGDHKGDREKKFAEASKRLNLSESQQADLKKILESNKAEMKAWKEANKDATKDQKRAAAMAQFKKADGQITAILDAKQQTTYNQMKAEKKKELQEKHAAKMKEHEEMEEYKGIF
jgi:hypothetical protein